MLPVEASSLDSRSKQEPHPIEIQGLKTARVATREIPGMRPNKPRGAVGEAREGVATREIPGMRPNRAWRMCPETRERCLRGLWAGVGRRSWREEVTEPRGRESEDGARSLLPGASSRRVRRRQSTGPSGPSRASFARMRRSAAFTHATAAQASTERRSLRIPLAGARPRVSPAVGRVPLCRAVVFFVAQWFFFVARKKARCYV